MAAARSRETLPTLETERLSLRASSMEDFEAWAKTMKAGFGENRQQAWEEFANYSAGWLLHGHGLLTVMRRQDNQIVGFVILGLEWGDYEPELGYMFDPDFHGQGYATEAAQAVRDYGFDLLGEGMFVSYISKKNAASNAVAQRLGAHRDRAKEDKLGFEDNCWRHGVPA